MPMGTSMPMSTIKLAGRAGEMLGTSTPLSTIKLAGRAGEILGTSTPLRGKSLIRILSIFQARGGRVKNLVVQDIKVDSVVIVILFSDGMRMVI